jgi:predicted  nucleic acid-binding Zn-ribbon protein
MENTTPQNDITKTFSELVEILANKLTDRISEQTATKAMAKLEGKLPGLDEVCDLNSQIVDLQKQIQACEETVEEYKDDHEDRIDTLESQAEELRDEMQECVTEDGVRTITQQYLEDELNGQLADMVKEYLTENLQITFSFKN